MKKIFYYLMRKICWILEDIHDFFSKDKSSFYPSYKWEILYEITKIKKIKGEK